MFKRMIGSVGGELFSENSCQLNFGEGQGGLVGKSDRHMYFTWLEFYQLKEKVLFSFLWPNCLNHSLFVTSVSVLRYFFLVQDRKLKKYTM